MPLVAHGTMKTRHRDVHPARWANICVHPKDTCQAFPVDLLEPKPSFVPRGTHLTNGIALAQGRYPSTHEVLP